MAEKTIVTPRGTAIWPRLNTPDTKFDSDGVYTCKLAVDADDPSLEKFRAQVQEAIDAKYDEIVDDLKSKGKGAVAKKVTKVDPFHVEEDDETGEETGRIVFNTKMKASGVSKKTGKPWKRKVAIFDAKGTAISKPPFINGGSEVKLSVQLLGYYIAKDKEVGCSIRLEAVQVLKLVTGGHRDAGGYGFGEEEGDELVDQSDDFEDETVDEDDDEDDI